MIRLTAFLLLFAVHVSAQVLPLPPPVDTVKKRHGGAATLSWNPMQVDPAFALQYISIKSTPDRSLMPQQIATAAPTATSATVVVNFTAQYPKFVYFVISGMYQGAKGVVESRFSETVEAERIGPPPSP